MVRSLGAGSLRSEDKGEFVASSMIDVGLADMGFGRENLEIRRSSGRDHVEKFGGKRQRKEPPSFMNAKSVMNLKTRSG